MTARTNLVLDLAITSVFLVLSNPPLTGMAVHEWLGLGLAVALVVHLLLHWEWIVGISTRLFGGLARGVRLNYVIDLVLFVAFISVVLSGVMMSKSVLPAFGLHASPERAWRGIHDFSANLLVVAVAAHVGLHWTWIVTHTKRLVSGRPRVAADAGVPANVETAS